MVALQPMNPDTTAVQDVPSPVVTCEAGCGTRRPSHRMVNFIPVVGSPGHESLAPFQCHATQIDPNTPMQAGGHWACSEECMELVMHACITEHMIPMLRAIRGTLDKELLQ